MSVGNTTPVDFLSGLNDYWGPADGANGLEFIGLAERWKMDGRGEKKTRGEKPQAIEKSSWLSLLLLFALCLQFKFHCRCYWPSYVSLLNDMNIIIIILFELFAAGNDDDDDDDVHRLAINDDDDVQWILCGFSRLSLINFARRARAQSSFGDNKGEELISFAQNEIETIWPP